MPAVKLGRCSKHVRFSNRAREPEAVENGPMQNAPRCRKTVASGGAALETRGRKQRRMKRTEQTPDRWPQLAEDRRRFRRMGLQKRNGEAYASPFRRNSGASAPAFFPFRVSARKLLEDFSVIRFFQTSTPARRRWDTRNQAEAYRPRIRSRRQYSGSPWFSVSGRLSPWEGRSFPGS